MKPHITLLFFILFSISYSQTNSTKKDILDANYTVFNNTLLKKTKHKTYTYKNILLGDISSVDVINTQEVVLFYNDFNTVVILDNQLNLIQTVSLKNSVLFAKKGIANTLWIFNSDENRIELYDYKSKKTLLSSQSIINFEPIEMDSSFNFIKLIGKEKTLVFNRYLNLTETIIPKKND